jgi:hypothetical protein
VRYANDLLLTDLARRITNEMSEINALLTNGRLNDAKEKASVMKVDLGGLVTRLDDVIQERK